MAPELKYCRRKPNTISSFEVQGQVNKLYTRRINFIYIYDGLTNDIYHIQESATFVVFAANHVGISEPSEIIWIPQMKNIKHRGEY